MICRDDLPANATAGPLTVGWTPKGYAIGRDYFYINRHGQKDADFVISDPEAPLYKSLARGQKALAQLLATGRCE